MKTPCMDCPRVGCGSYHDICPEYQKFRKDKETEYEKRRISSTAAYDYSEVIRRQIARAKQGS